MMKKFKKYRLDWLLIFWLIFFIAFSVLLISPATASDKIDEAHDHIKVSDPEGKAVQRAIEVLKLASEAPVANDLQQLLNNGRIAKEKNGSLEGSNAIGLPPDWPLKAGEKGTVGGGGLIILGDPRIGNANLPKDNPINNLDDLIKLTKEQFEAVILLAQTLRHEKVHVDRGREKFEKSWGQWKKCKSPHWAELECYYSAFLFKKRLKKMLLEEFQKELADYLANKTPEKAAKLNHKKDLIDALNRDISTYLHYINGKRDSDGDRTVDKNYEQGGGKNNDIKSKLKELKDDIKTVDIEKEASTQTVNQFIQNTSDDSQTISNEVTNSVTETNNLVSLLWPADYINSALANIDGAVGGTINLGEEASAYFPTGSFTGTLSMSINKIYPYVPRDNPYQRLVSGQYDLLPSRAFDKPVRITFKYDADADPNRINIYWLDGIFGMWRKIPFDRQLDLENHTISVSTYHFTTFAVFEESPPVPSTSTWAILALGFAGLVMLLWQRRRRGHFNDSGQEAA